MPVPTHSEITPPSSPSDTTQTLEAIAQTTQSLRDTLRRVRSDLREGVEGLERALARLGTALESIEASRTNRIAPPSRRLSRHRLADMPRAYSPLRPSDTLAGRRNQGPINAPSANIPPTYRTEALREPRTSGFHLTHSLSPLSNSYPWPVDPPRQVRGGPVGSLLSENVWGEIDIYDLWSAGTEPIWPTLHQIHARCRPPRADRSRGSRYRRGLPELPHGDFDLVNDRLENLLSSLEKRQSNFPIHYPTFWAVCIIDMARAIKGQDPTNTGNTSTPFCAKYETCVSHFLYVFQAGLDASVADLASYNTLAWVINCLPVRELLEHESVARAFGCPSTTPTRPPNRYSRVDPTVIPPQPAEGVSNGPLRIVGFEKGDQYPHRDSTLHNTARDLPRGLPPTNLARVAAAPKPIIVKSTRPVTPLPRKVSAIAAKERSARDESGWISGLRPASPRTFGPARSGALAQSEVQGQPDTVRSVPRLLSIVGDRDAERERVLETDRSDAVQPNLEDDRWSGFRRSARSDFPNLRAYARGPRSSTIGSTPVDPDQLQLPSPLPELELGNDNGVDHSSLPRITPVYHPAIGHGQLIESSHQTQWTFPHRSPLLPRSSRIDDNEDPAHHAFAPSPWDNASALQTSILSHRHALPPSWRQTPPEDDFGPSPSSPTVAGDHSSMSIYEALQRIPSPRRSTPTTPLVSSSGQSRNTDRVIARPPIRAGPSASQTRPILPDSLSAQSIYEALEDGPPTSAHRAQPVLPDDWVSPSRPTDRSGVRQRPLSSSLADLVDPPPGRAEATPSSAPGPPPGFEHVRPIANGRSRNQPSRHRRTDNNLDLDQMALNRYNTAVSHYSNLTSNPRRRLVGPNGPVERGLEAAEAEAEALTLAYARARVRVAAEMAGLTPWADGLRAPHPLAGVEDESTDEDMDEDTDEDEESDDDDDDDSDEGEEDIEVDDEGEDQESEEEEEYDGAQAEADHRRTMYRNLDRREMQDVDMAIGTIDPVNTAESSDDRMAEISAPSSRSGLDPTVRPRNSLRPTVDRLAHQPARWEACTPHEPRMHADSGPERSSFWVDEVYFQPSGSGPVITRQPEFEQREEGQRLRHA